MTKKKKITNKIQYHLTIFLGQEEKQKLIDYKDQLNIEQPKYPKWSLSSIMRLALDNLMKEGQ
jgi:hypothetical protein